jgi:hypothetical protein
METGECIFDPGGLMGERVASIAALAALLAVATGVQAMGLYGTGGKWGVGGTVAGDHMWYLKIGISRDLALEGSLDWDYDSRDGVADRFWLGAGLLWHSWQGERIRPYGGMRAALAVYSGGNEDDTRFALLPSAGVEYFIVDALSLGAEASLPLSFGSFSLETTTVAAVRYYF